MTTTTRRLIDFSDLNYQRRELRDFKVGDILKLRVCGSTLMQGRVTREYNFGELEVLFRLSGPGRMFRNGIDHMKLNENGSQNTIRFYDRDSTNELDKRVYAVMDQILSEVNL